MLIGNSENISLKNITFDKNFASRIGGGVALLNIKNSHI